MIFSSTKPHRLYTSINNKDKSFTSVFSDKTYYSNSLPKSQFVEDKPLLSFTSFQHYLQECNQNEFKKREHQRVNRSANKAKTQAYFNYNREKSNTSQAKRKQINKYVLQDGLNEPFYPCQTSPIIKHQTQNNFNRNLGSKSSSDNYYVHEENSLLKDMFDEKFGTIEGWNEEQKIQTKNYGFNNNKEETFVSSKSILQERKLNCIMTNRVNKSSKNSFRKENNKQVTYTETKQQNPPTIKQTLSSSKKAKKSLKNNKQNLCLTQFTQPSLQHPSSPSPQRLFRPVQLHQKQYTNKINPLTSINQLQEEILMSKRQPQFPRSFSSRDRANEDLEKFEKPGVKDNENIKMLKKEFQYLCRDELHEEWDSEGEKRFKEIGASDSVKNINKQLKYFKRFPNHQNKQNTTCYQFDNGNPPQTNRPKTTQAQPTHSNMLKLLQSINHTTPNDNSISHMKTPIKRKLLQYTNTNTPHNMKKDDMKSISKQKERFHESIKDRKSQSAFHCVNGVGGTDDKKQSGGRVLKERRENSLIITVVSSFKSCDSNAKTNSKLNSKNFSLLNNRNSILLTSQPSSNKQNSSHVIKKHRQTSLFQKDFLPKAKQIHSSQPQVDEGFEDLRLNQSISQTMDLMQSISGIANEQNQQSLEKLNILSQQLKKCSKMPVTTKYINLANKNFTYLNSRAVRLNNKKDKREKSKEETKNVIKNLTITQLEGRHIEKLRKRFDINNP